MRGLLKKIYLFFQLDLPKEKKATKAEKKVLLPVKKKKKSRVRIKIKHRERLLESFDFSGLFLRIKIAEGRIKKGK